MSYKGECRILPILLKHLTPLGRTFALKQMKNQSILAQQNRHSSALCNVHLLHVILLGSGSLASHHMLLEM